MRILVDIINSKGGHDDMRLSVPEIDLDQVADSYYFAIDSIFKTGDETNRKTILNICNLLTGWIYLVDMLKVDEVVYLPFDFSDQCIGLLKVKFIDKEFIQLEYGCTQKETGWSLYPSQYNELKLTEEDFESLSSTSKISKKKIIDDISTSIESIKILGPVDES